MLKVFVQGLKGDIHNVDLECPASEIPEIFPEFFGNVKVKGIMRILGKRHTIEVVATCSAKLICDITLEEYVEEIKTEINIAYIADGELCNFGSDSDVAVAEERIVHPDEKYIDITEEVREELCVNLPLKRVAPQYRDKELCEIFPELIIDDESTPLDDRWADLKKIKLN